MSLQIPKNPECLAFEASLATCHSLTDEGLIQKIVKQPDSSAMRQEFAIMAILKLCYQSDLDQEGLLIFLTRIGIAEESRFLTLLTETIARVMPEYRIELKNYFYRAVKKFLLNSEEVSLERMAFLSAYMRFPVAENESILIVLRSNLYLFEKTSAGDLIDILYYNRSVALAMIANLSFRKQYCDNLPLMRECIRAKLPTSTDFLIDYVSLVVCFTAALKVEDPRYSEYSYDRLADVRMLDERVRFVAKQEKLFYSEILTLLQLVYFSAVFYHQVHRLEFYPKQEDPFSFVLTVSMFEGELKSRALMESEGYKGKLSNLYRELYLAFPYAMQFICLPWNFGVFPDLLKVREKLVEFPVAFRLICSDFLLEISSSFSSQSALQYALLFLDVLSEIALSGEKIARERLREKMPLISRLLTVVVKEKWIFSAYLFLYAELMTPLCHAALSSNQGKQYLDDLSSWLVTQEDARADRANCQLKSYLEGVMPTRSLTMASKFFMPFPIIVLPHTAENLALILSK